MMCGLIMIKLKNLILAIYINSKATELKQPILMFFMLFPFILLFKLNQSYGVNIFVRNCVQSGQQICKYCSSNLF